MSSDEKSGSQRAIRRPRVPPGPLGGLKALIYELYLAAGTPTLDEIAAAVAADDELAGAPGRDTIGRIIGGPEILGSQADVAAVVTVLAREARWNAGDAAGRARDLWIAARLATAAGVPLDQVTDPFALEVHRPVQPDGPQAGLPALPAYVPREHDQELGRVVQEAAGGWSGIAVLVGGSSTGKTRACWEALHLLRDQPGPWRLWHPIDPARPDAALRELPAIGPRTVVWLNEAQFYLSPAAGEQVAAGLRELLRDRDRGPVLVLATLWPEFWAVLTARPAEPEDPHAQARELLAGHDIQVASKFTAGQLRELEKAADPRLAQAAAATRDGRVVQYLAGAPDLLDRYRNAMPAVRALLDAAMDARRLGTGSALSRAFLEAAAPGYLTDADWDQMDDDWLERALGETAKPRRGIRGPLFPIRPHLAAAAQVSAAGRPAWQLADYLDQQGRRIRAGEIPPETFWAAAASHADPADLIALALAAKDRGLYRTAAVLYKRASALGYPKAGAELVRSLHILHPGDRRPADWATAPANLDDPGSVAALLSALSAARATAQVTALLHRDPAAQVSLDDPAGVARLLHELNMARADGQVNALASRAASHTSLDDPRGVRILLNALLAVPEALIAFTGPKASGPVTVLLDRDPAAQVSFDKPRGLAELLLTLHVVGAAGQVNALASRAAAHISLDDPRAVASLLAMLERAGPAGQVPLRGLLDRNLAAQVSLNDSAAVANLLLALHTAGAAGQVTALLKREPFAQVRFDDPITVAFLLEALAHLGAAGQGAIAALLERNPAAQVSLDNPAGVAGLLESLYRVGAAGQVTALLERDPAAQVSLDDPAGVAGLLLMLCGTGAAGQVTALLERDPAAQISLDDPGGVERLLRALARAGAATQVTELASRAAAQARINNPAGWGFGSLGEDSATELIRALSKTGAEAQAAELIERLPAAGRFDLFCSQGGRAEQFRFGREADGRPAGPWDWTDLS